MGDDAVKCFRTETTGDDNRLLQRLSERLQGILAECSQILHVFGRRLVPDAVGAGGCTLGELPEFEVRW